MQLHQVTLGHQSSLLRLAGRRGPVVQPTRPGLTRSLSGRRSAAEVKNMLREIAYVLHLTQKVKATMAVPGERPGQ
jgi:hypothetical protein